MSTRLKESVVNHSGKEKDMSTSMVSEAQTAMDLLFEFCEDSIAQVKQFMYILYGSCVRFYSTVVEWDFL